MDKKRLFIAMTLAVALVLVWDPFLRYLDKKFNWGLTPATQTQQPQTAAAPDGTGRPPPTTSTAPTTRQAATDTQPGPTTGQALAQGLRAVPSAAEAARPTDIGSATVDDPAYAMLVRLSPTGAGVESVVLNQFAKSVETDERYTFQQPYA